jgi:predicted neutral ceramidase superfamily lipid hydrolase
MTTVDDLTKRVDSHIESFEKRFQKHEELRLIDGDHMSHIRADLTEVKNILIKNAEETKKYREVVDLHMARVEPVIKAYEEEVNAKKYLNDKGQYIVKLGGIIGSIIVIGTAIIWALKKVL